MIYNRLISTEALLDVYKRQVCMLGATSVKAQEFTIQGDFVSSYVWRGIYQGGAASFQPTLGFKMCIRDSA